MTKATIPTRRRPAVMAGAAGTALVLVVVALTAVLLRWQQGGPEAITATSSVHRVEFRLDDRRLGPLDAELLVQDLSGRPAATDEISLEAVMPSMGHGTAELTAVPAGEGRYRVRGELFAMAGDWEVTVRIAGPPAAPAGGRSAGAVGSADSVVLPVTVNR